MRYKYSYEFVNYGPIDICSTQTVVWEFIINYRQRRVSKDTSPSYELENTAETIIITNASYRIISALSKSQFEHNRLSHPIPIPRHLLCPLSRFSPQPSNLISRIQYPIWIPILSFFLLILLLLHLPLSFKSIIFRVAHAHSTSRTSSVHLYLQAESPFITPWYLLIGGDYKKYSG